MQMKTKAYTVNDNLTDHTNAPGVIGKGFSARRAATIRWCTLRRSFLFVGIVYDPKIKAFMEYVQGRKIMSTWGRRLFLARCAKKLTFIVSHRDEICAQLAEKDGADAGARKTAVLAAGLIRGKQNKSHKKGSNMTMNKTKTESWRLTTATRGSA